jgi:hypothetical protein
MIIILETLINIFRPSTISFVIGDAMERKPKTTIAIKNQFLPEIIHVTMNPPNKKTSQKRKRVHFLPYVIVCNTISFHDYTKTEIQVCWYSREERKQIRREVNHAIDWMTPGRKQEDLSCLSRLEKEEMICTRASGRRVDGYMYMYTFPNFLSPGM